MSIHTVVENLNRELKALENVEAYIGTIGENGNIEISEDILQTKRRLRLKEVATYNVAPCLSCGSDVDYL